MPGLDDLIGTLQGAGGGQGGGLEGILGGLLGGGSASGADTGGLGGLLGGSAGTGGLGGMLGGLLGGGQAGATQGGSGAMAMLAPLIASLLANGGLQQILGGMRASGFSAQADSWVGTGDNQPIAPEHVQQALGSAQIEQVAQQLGVDSGQASALLAQILPGLVNAVTPDGEEPTAHDLSRLVQTLQGGGG